MNIPTGHPKYALDPDGNIYAHLATVPIPLPVLELHRPTLFDRVGGGYWILIKDAVAILRAELAQVPCSIPEYMRDLLRKCADKLEWTEAKIPELALSKGETTTVAYPPNLVGKP